MKKGIINIILIVLTLTNVILTAIVVFSVVPAMKQVSSLVGKVASAIDLQKGVAQDSGAVSVSDLTNYTLEDKITVNLASGADGKTHYAQVQVTLVLNTKSDDYSVYKSAISSKEENIKAIVIDLLSTYTVDNVVEEKSSIEDELLTLLRAYFDNTTFIYDVQFSGFTVS